MTKDVDPRLHGDDRKGQRDDRKSKGMTEKQRDDRKGHGDDKKARE
jgi:hypothetical protein